MPKTEFGKFYLTQNAANYFAEIEQAAFSPAHMVRMPFRGVISTKPEHLVG